MNVMRSGGPPARTATAVLTILSLVTPGCAVHTWQPASDAELRRQGGQSVRVDGPLGWVEIAGATLSYPILTGRPIAGNGPVSVAVEPGTIARVGGCRGDHDDGRVLEFEVQDVSSLIGCDVQLETARRSVAVRVRGSFEGEVFGVPLPCRDERGRRLECTGRVRVDLRQYERLDVRRQDQALSVAATVAAVGAVAVTALYVAAAFAFSNME